MSDAKIISFKTNSPYHLSGCPITLEWKAENCFYVILKIGNKIKLFKKNENTVDVILYTNRKIKIYGIGNFSIDSKELHLNVRNIEKTEKTFQVLENSVSLNQSIDSLRLNQKINSCIIKDIDTSIKNINFTVKDIKINQEI